MRKALIMCLALMIAACSGEKSVDAQATPAETFTDQPNILILMAEDMSSRVGAFDDPVAQTPNLDALAQTSVRYPNTFTTAGVCAPSRTAHITGVHQVTVGGQHMRTRSFAKMPYRAIPPADVKAYPELMRHAGYYTFTNNKLDYQFSNTSAGTGPFTIWDYEGGSPDWNKRAKGQPFFALINFKITHESQLFKTEVEKNRSKGYARVVTPNQVEVPPYYPDTPVVRETIAQQYDNIYQMDKEVGALLAKLKEDGLAENTIVIWTTDHGDGLPRAKREIYDSGIKVPLIIHRPEKFKPASMVPGSIDERLISFVDIGPSVLSMAGVDVPAFMQGYASLTADGHSRDYVFASKDRLDEFPFRERVVRGQRYKYLYNYQPGEPGARHLAYRDKLEMMRELWALYETGQLNAAQSFWFEPRPQEELYDLELDPYEINNLADDPRFNNELVRMRQALKSWQERVSDLSEQSEEDMALAFWPEGKQPLTPAPSFTVLGSHDVQLNSNEVGASLGYRFDDGAWQAYEPDSIIKAAKDSILYSKAVRYGWQESAEISHKF
ncbi:MAG: sulfatase [Pseudomonadales bacterium]